MTLLVGWAVVALPVGMLIGGSIALADRMDPRTSRHRPTPGVTMKGGQVLMGPQQPRPPQQRHIPGPPPRSPR